VSRFRQRAYVLYIGILLLITSFVAQIKTSDADIADTASLVIGGTMSNGSLSMPRADARIRILYPEDGGIRINVTCDFEVIPLETVNASLAFVYPMYWHLAEGFTNIDFGIAINNSHLDYTLVNYSYLISQGYVLNSTEMGGTWIESTEFVVFGYEMQFDETYVIRVTTSAVPIVSHNYVSFDYIVASAKTFQGQTHQTVEMHVIEKKSFVDFSFYPDDFLTESTNGTGTTALWDLVINQSTNINQVGFYATIQKYVPYRPTPEIIALILWSSVLVVSLSVVIMVRVRKR
jgi:hypothetical protein